MKSGSFTSILLLLLSLCGASQAQEAQMGERPYQGFYASKLYNLKYAKAPTLAPVVEGALRNGTTEASAECVAKDSDSLLVTMPQSAIPTADALIKALDAPPVKAPQPDDSYQSYKPRYLSPRSAAKLIAALPAQEEPSVEAFSNTKEGLVYWKGGTPLNEAVARLMESSDKPQTKIKIVIKAYRLNTLGVKYLEAAMEGENEGSFNENAMKHLASRRGVSYVASIPFDIAPEAKANSALLNAGDAGKCKITIAYPVVETKAGGAVSIYTDIVFDYEGDMRCTRLTLESGKEIPIAAFALKGPYRDKSTYLDIATLPYLLNRDDKAPIAGDMLMITACILPN